MGNLSVGYKFGGPHNRTNKINDPSSQKITTANLKAQGLWLQDRIHQMKRVINTYNKNFEDLQELKDQIEDLQKQLDELKTQVK